MENLQLGELQTNGKGGKYLPIVPPLRWSSSEWAEVLFEPSTFDGNGDRASLCLRLSDEAAAFAAGVEKAAAAQAAKNPKVFGSPATEAQIRERMQPNARPDKRAFKMKMSLSRVRCWDASGTRLPELPGELRGRKVLVALEARQLWVMGQQCGVLLEVRDLKVGEPEGCPL
jgi:hypothetical protein